MLGIGTKGVGPKVDPRMSFSFVFKRCPNDRSCSPSGCTLPALFFLQHLSRDVTATKQRSIRRRGNFRRHTQSASPNTATAVHVKIKAAVLSLHGSQSPSGVTKRSGCRLEGPKSQIPVMQTNPKKDHSC